MIFEVKWHPKASRNLTKLPRFLIERILKKVDDVKKDPFRYLEHLAKEGLYKLRIGDYRAIVEVDFKYGILYILVFDKRGRVYER